MIEVQDRIPLGNSKNNIIKASIPTNTTLAQLITMLNSGLYADVMVNNATDGNAGALQLGVPTNKSLFDSIIEGTPELPEKADVELQYGTFVNAGAGWQTKTFDKPFNGAPRVFVSSSFEGFIRIQNVTATSFQYCLEAVGVTTTPTTGSYYTASGAAASSTHSANTLVNGVSSVINLNTTATAYSVDFFAIYDGE